jgi:hypothetical protein
MTLGSGEWKLVTPDGHNARYDSMHVSGPGSKTMIEAKIRHEFMEDTSSFSFIQHYPKLLKQFTQQQKVANMCGYSYIIAVDNPSGTEALKNVFPDFPIYNLDPGWR